MVAICASAREGSVCSQADVRFGSKADMCRAKGHVRFAPNSDRESGLPQTVMSALPPKADMCSARARVCFGPKADSCSAAKWLFDHFIGTGEHSRWECETHFLGGLKINHQLILGRRLHGHLGWLLALENAINIVSRLPVLIEEVGSIRDQPPSGSEGALVVDSGQLVPRRKRDDQIAMKHCWRTRRHDQTAIWNARESRYRVLELAGVAEVDRDHLHPERRRHSLDDAEHGDPGRIRRIANYRCPFRAGRDLFEQLKPFTGQAVFQIHEASGVAAWPRQVVNEAGADWISDNREHNWHGTCRLQQRRHGRTAMGQDNVGRKRGQFCCMSANGGYIGGSPTSVDPHIAADDPTQLP